MAVTIITDKVWLGGLAGALVFVGLAAVYSLAAMLFKWPRLGAVAFIAEAVGFLLER